MKNGMPKCIMPYKEHSKCEPVHGTIYFWKDSDLADFTPKL
jgi:hypothetical protein